MSGADEPSEGNDAGFAREYGSVGLVVACVVAVVLATALIPAASSVGLGGAPAESLVPIPAGAEETAGGDGGGGQGGGFGALNVGNETSVGGPIGQGGENAFRSQDTEVHFQVRSEESSYWRTGAYDTYTGDGWARSGPSDATAPVEGRAVQYRVELARSASSVPTVWRPTSLDQANGLELTGGGLAQADGPLPAGTSYVGVSRKPPRDPAVLRSTSRDYPDEIERRYTELPPSSAVSLQPITDNITRDADNPYEAAKSIERWLETNKEYSLNVSEPSSDNVAREFITQMDAGYCEYFATAMTTMLRSQDIPARYVIGYSTGQQVGANRFQVRAMNAHAWVEVYFEDVGWVRFDPTPGSERLQQEQAAYEESGETGTYDPQESGSPGETFSPDSPDRPGTETGTPPDPGSGERPVSTPPPTPEQPGETPTPVDPDEPSTGAYELSLNRTPIPGEPVEVSVTADGQPVVGATVEFDGEAVGQTDEEGAVTATVPYSETLNVTVVEATAEQSLSAGGAGSLTGAPSSLPPPGAGLLAPLQTADNTTRSFEVATEAALSVAGDVQTGESITVTATVDGVAVPNATVSLDGERVGRTDREGRAQVRLPDSPGNVTLAVERDPVAGNRTLRLGALTVSGDPVWPLPVAGTPLDVTVRLDNESVAGVPVAVGGVSAGETAVDGTVTAALPFASNAAVVAETGGQTARTTVSNPLANAAGAGAVLFVLGSVAAVAVRRGTLHPVVLADRLRSGVRAVARFAVHAFVGFAEVAAARVERTVEHLRALLAGDRSLADLSRAFLAWVEAWLDRLKTGIDRPLDSGGQESDPTDDGAAATETAAHVTIREAWGRFLGYVSVRKPWTKTPGQLADHAVTTDELPPAAVATLRDEFRAVEYGPRSPDDSVPAVEAAIERIERAVGTDGGDGADAAGDDAGASTDPTSGSGASTDVSSGSRTGDTPPQGGDD